MEEQRLCHDKDDSTFSDNKNVNYIVVKNLKHDETVDINDYIPLIRRQRNSDLESTNVNTNVIIIENIISEEDEEPKMEFKNIPHDEMDRCGIEQTSNRNVNFVIIRNVIPIKKYVG